MCIVCDKLVQCEYNTSYVISTIQKAFFSACGLIKVKEKDLLSVGIDKQILGYNILMYDS